MTNNVYKIGDGSNRKSGGSKRSDGGGPGGPDNMEERISKLESSIAKIDERLSHTPSKAMFLSIIGAASLAAAGFAGSLMTYFHHDIKASLSDVNDNVKINQQRLLDTREDLAYLKGAKDSDSAPPAK
jgi:ABC-type Fe3+-citrate transport system substrate-binding protein